MWIALWVILLLSQEGNFKHIFCFYQKSLTEKIGLTAFQLCKSKTSIWIITDIMAFTSTHKWHQQLWLSDQKKLFVIHNMLAIMNISTKCKIKCKTILLPEIKDDIKAKNKFGLN